MADIQDQDIPSQSIVIDILDTSPLQTYLCSGPECCINSSASACVSNTLEETPCWDIRKVAASSAYPPENPVAPQRCEGGDAQLRRREGDSQGQGAEGE
jgi:hypothetical protein